jgi:sulfite exporter TauE/SafE
MSSSSGAATGRSSAALTLWPARGAVFALAGVLVIEAAVTYQPAKAGGIDKALLTLRNQPFGEFLLILAALGLIIFGIYGLCEARWRRV